MRQVEGINYPPTSSSINADVAEATAWAFAGEVVGVIGSEVASEVLSAASLARSMYKISPLVTMKPNPLFEAYGFDADELNIYKYGTCSPETQKYLLRRKKKDAAKTVGSYGGKFVPVLNPVKLIRGLNGTVASGRHIHTLHAMLKKYRQSRDMSEMIDMVMDNKKLSTGHAVATAVSSGAPGGSVISVGTAISKGGYKYLNAQKLIYFSTWLHFKAYREMRIARLFGGTSGPQGPASDLFFELFTRRGFTAVFGKYETAKIMAEPCGWQAVHQKMTHLE
ncbi:hypothetical protein GCM10007094_44230 [Pseudovibrio japonicus]|uniref:Uncharacterized protein n=1 Tax=Pseudovibrio japonicus TaxID=366534 RepID=A0ABQ3ETS5_9HYPH|nr:hypothetical protein [Pseudovibrio japonicus]GHB50119.1 hypothetical protein GCM10007094_44230 [Pseudovibrio japonicus]